MAIQGCWGVKVDTFYEYSPPNYRVEAGDRFGAALAVGDFDGDYRKDLAVCHSGEDNRAGAVTVIYSNSQGLESSRREFWYQGSPGVPGSPEEIDFFGASLTALRSPTFLGALW